MQIDRDDLGCNKQPEMRCRSVFKRRSDSQDPVEIRQNLSRNEDDEAENSNFQPNETQPNDGMG